MDFDEIDLQWFAAEDEGRTEQPTEHKIRKAREEGRVAKSQDLNAAIIMLLCVIVLIIAAPYMIKQCVGLMKFLLTRCTELEVNDGRVAKAFYSTYFKMIVPVASVAVVAGIVANLIQNRGFIFSTKPITPQFSKIVPNFANYFKKTLFSFEGVFNVIKSIVKVVVLFFIAYLIIKNDLNNLLKLQTVSIWAGFKHIAAMSAKILAFAAVFFLVVAIPDYLVQRRQFIESLKMSKQEIKEEYKELEGDPQVKGRLMQRMRQMLQQNLPRAVAESDVIVTNPTHYAVALKYDQATMSGPMVTAKGADNLAFRIKDLARENDVPIIENRPVARGLYTEAEIGAIIPEAYFRAMANIFAHVYELNKNKSE
jgi:flagellar biosynthetic protein FlhB